MSVALACLLLCSFAMPVFADDENTPFIAPGDGQPIALGETMNAQSGDLISFFPDEIGWVRFVASEEMSVVVWFVGDPGESNLVYGHGHSNVTSIAMKALEGYPICFQIREFCQTQTGTVTLLPAEPPVLKQTQLKEWPSSPLEYQPFQGDDYWAVFATVNGKPDYETPGVFYYCSPTLIRTYNAQPGAYELWFFNYDGEDLGTLTIMLEEWSDPGGNTQPPKGIFGTNPRYNQWYHYILFFLAFGFIWMWF